MSWGTYPTKGSRCLLSSEPKSETRPVWGSSPSMARNRVDLPAPFVPRTPSTSPPFTEKLARSTATTSPYFTVMPWTSSTGVMWRGGPRFGTG